MEPVHPERAPWLDFKWASAVHGGPSLHDLPKGVELLWGGRRRARHLDLQDLHFASATDDVADQVEVLVRRHLVASYSHDHLTIDPSPSLCIK